MIEFKAIPSSYSTWTWSQICANPVLNHDVLVLYGMLFTYVGGIGNFIENLPMDDLPIDDLVV